MAMLRRTMLLIRAFLGDRAAFAAENLALRQQPAALKARAKRPRLRKRDRIFWVRLSRLWTGWRSALLIVQPDTAEWTAQQIVEAFPFDEAPRFLIRDRDGVYGSVFQEHVKNVGVEEVFIAPRSPWQNPYAERLIGSIRRECLDHVVVLHERHLRRIPRSYFEHYLRSRAHVSLNRNAPVDREVELPDRGQVVATP